MSARSTPKRRLSVQLKRCMLGLGLGGLLCLGVWTASFGAANFDKLLSTSLARWGNRMVVQVGQWRNLIQNASLTDDLEQVARVNSYFNRLMRFGEDTEVWGQADYWATPMESVWREAGDCEDFAIAKYFTLLETGVNADKLRLIYVRAKLSAMQDAIPHMVLAYYPQPNAEPLILDNLINEIQPASRRSDLTPVFSFNSRGVFNGSAGTSALVSGGTGRYSKWEDLLRRARAEGFD